MPRLKKRELKSLKSWGAGHEDFLFYGQLGPSEWDACFQLTRDEIDPAILADMESAWEVFREPIFANWFTRWRLYGTRPAGYWLFDAPEQRNYGEKEIDQLQRLNLLNPGELDAYIEVTRPQARDTPRGEREHDLNGFTPG